MSTEKPQPVKTFVSYSWTSQVHVDRIIEICKRLANNGVDIVLDKWELKEGHDKYAFMERMVIDPDVKKVIIFSDQLYTEKANSKTGGVGTESQIISKKIYDQVKQDKFIPVLLEFTENSEPYLPVFLQNRIYIDFSTAQKQNENYEQLLRAIFDQPLHKKPQVGSPPSYIFAKATAYTSARSSLEAFKNCLLDDRSNYVPLARSYLKDFLGTLENFVCLPNYTSELADILKSNINDMLQSRDELLEFFEIAFSFKEDSQLLEVAFEYLEGALKLNFANQNMKSWQEWQFENFRFFNHECFIYLLAFLLRYRRYNLAKMLMNHRYYLGADSVVGSGVLLSYRHFYSYSRILDEENRRLNQRRISTTADLFHTRATNKTIDFTQFMQADFVLFLESLLKNSSGWYPISLVYARYTRPFELFLRAETEDGFEILKNLFEVSSRDDFRIKYTQAMEKAQQSMRELIFQAGISFEELVNFEKICRIKIDS